jgi:prepilin-type processing-associated H-X9-DG protein
MPTAALPARFHLGGFTLLELTAVVAIITVLVSLLIAALNQTKEKALRISCMENVKQLQFAWQMYTDDDPDGRLPLNQTAQVDSPHHRIPQRGSSTNSWVVGDPVTDPRTASLERGTLFPYVKSVGPYRCQMDDSRVVGHPQVLRTRSYSMNAFLGGDEDLNPAMKYVELERPGNTFVFIEEHEQSRWESSFVVLPALRPGKMTAAGAPVQSWVSTPSDRHAQGCSLSFADGHAEYWRWYSPKTIRDSKLSSAASKSRDLRDLTRLQSVVGQ